LSLASGRLTDMQAGDRLVVVEVDDHNPELLRYLGSLGLFPGTELLLLECAPFDGPFTLDVGGQQHSLGQRAAQSILVARK
jgi:DtxR family Mn-dependent transcriptional regulator